jgi:UPF0755 protein
MKKVLLALVILVTVGLLAAAGVYFHYEQAVVEFESTPFGDVGVRVVNLPKGSDATTVGKYLAREKIISDADRWHLWLRWRKLEPKLKAGEYEFAGPLTPGQVVDKVVRGEVMLHHFTVVEGSRCDEAMPVIGASDLGLDAATLLKLCTDRGFLRKAGIKGDRLEGYVFPDTYSFPKGVTEEQVVLKMVQRTKEEIAKALASRGGGAPLTETEAVTLASIVEKETGCPEERSSISCVFHNRLKRHIKLQTDPTVLYGMFVKTGKFDVGLAKHGWVAARTDENAYNTYLIPGLPIGPIANPGAAAIQATLNPKDPCEYVFFVAGPSGCSIFSKTLEEHERNVSDRNGRIRGQTQ